MPYDTQPKPRGFAALSPERRREIAAMGGRAVPDSSRGFSNREVAMEAGRKGGKNSRGGGRKPQAVHADHE